MDAGSLISPSKLLPYLDAFREIWRVIVLTQHFVLIPIEVARPEIARALAHWLGEQGHPVTMIEPADETAWAELAPALLRAAPGPDGVVLVLAADGKERGIGRGLRLLNQRRDSVAKHLARPLLWCGPRAFLNRTWEGAPDFWSIRSVDHVLEPEATPELRMKTMPPPPTPSSPPAAPEPDTAALGELFEVARAQGDTNNAARLGARLAAAQIAAGADDLAEAVLETALKDLDGDGPDAARLRADLGFVEADLHRRRGSAVAAASTLTRMLSEPALDADLRLRARLALARVFLDARDFRSADRAYTQALDEARRLGDEARQAEVLAGRRDLEALAAQAAPRDDPSVVARPALGVPDHGEAVRISSPPRRQQDSRGDLLERAIRVCRLREASRGRRCDVFRKHADLPVGEYAEVTSRDPFGPPVTYALAAAHGGIDEAYIDALRTDARKRSNAAFSVLIHEGAAPPEEVLAHGGVAVQVTSFARYQVLIDFQGYVEQQTARLSADPVYPPRLFVPQHMTYTVGVDEHRTPNALEILEEWMSSSYGRLILVLGDFGTGKTFLLHELARRMGEPGRAVVPVLIEMRALEKARGLDALIAQHLALAGMPRIDLEAFRYMLFEGRIALLFDGFDELALRVSYERAADHFDTLLEAAQGNAKIVITSRTQHFLSDQQVKTALGEKALLNGFRLARLDAFDRPRIQQFLVNRLESPERAQARLELLDRVKDLLGLSQNPRMLGFITDIEEDKLLEAERGGEITAASLYRMLLDRWLVHEFERAHPKGITPGLTVAQRWRAATEMALLLWRRTERTVRVTEVPPDIVEAVLVLSSHEIVSGVAVQQVGSGTLLRRDEEGQFSFLHQSVLEWLVANAAAEDVRGRGDSAHLALAEMSDLMADFFTSLASRESATAWASRVVAAEDSGTIAVNNALRVLRRLGIEARRGLRFAGRDLRGQDLSGRDLRDADLTDADLSEARLVGANLAGATLRRARLVRADLCRVNAVGACFEEADLSFTRLLGAELRGVRWQGARLRAVKLAGAKLDLDGIPEKEVRLLSVGVTAPVKPFIMRPYERIVEMNVSDEKDVIISRHADGSIWFWENATGKTLRIESDSLKAMMSLVPIGEMALAASDPSVSLGVELIAKRHSMDIRLLRGQNAPIRTMAFRGRGSVVGFSPSNASVRIWDTCGKAMTVLDGYQRQIEHIALSADERFMASASSGEALHVWDVAGGTLVCELPQLTHRLKAIAIGSDPQMLAAALSNGDVHMWSIPSGESIRILSTSATSIVFSGDGKLLFASGIGGMDIWDASTGVHRAHLPIHCIEFVASESGRNVAEWSYSHTILTWETTGGHALARLYHPRTVNSTAFHGDDILASGCDDGIVRLWHVASSHPQALLEGHTGPVRSVAFAADGQLLASASDDGTIRFWHVPTGACLATLLSCPEGWAAFTPEGRYKISGDIQGSFWHAIGLARYEPGELDPYLPQPLRIPDDEPLFRLPPRGDG